MLTRDALSPSRETCGCDDSYPGTAEKVSSKVMGGALMFAIDEILKEGDWVRK